MLRGVRKDYESMITNCVNEKDYVLFRGECAIDTGGFCVRDWRWVNGYP